MASGLVWFSGTGTPTLATSDHSKALLTNPSDSGKVVTILLEVFFASQPVFVNGFINPTTALPTTNRTVHNGIFDGRAHSGQITFKHDVSATPISGGIPLSAALGVGAGSPVLIPGPFIMPPGNSLGFDAQATGNTQYALSLSWVEV